MTPTTRQVVLMKRTAVSAFPGPELVTGGDFSSSSGWTLDGASARRRYRAGRSTAAAQARTWQRAGGWRRERWFRAPTAWRSTSSPGQASTSGPLSAHRPPESNPYTDGTIGTNRTAVGSYSQDIVVASIAGQWLGIILDTTSAKVDNFSVKQVA
jgi:hypothetical protein